MHVADEESWTFDSSYWTIQFPAIAEFECVSYSDAEDKAEETEGKGFVFQRVDREVEEEEVCRIQPLPSRASNDRLHHLFCLHISPYAEQKWGNTC